MSTVPTTLVNVAVDSSPWPLVRADGSLTSPPHRWLPKRCVSCPGRPCRNHDKREAEVGTCVRKVDILQFRAAGQSLCIPGALTVTRWRTLPRKVKKTLRDRIVSLQDVAAWFGGVDHLSADYGAAVDNRVAETLGMFHDVQTTFSALIRSTEAWVAGQPGATREKQLEALRPVELTIVKTVELLQARIALMPLVANPAAASFGRKRRTPIYRACDRIVRILSPSASERSIRLHLSGKSFNDPNCYDSLDTIPLVLLDNAIKYSLSSQPVDITINDGPGSGEVTVEVSSVSPTIAREDRARIFEKGYRGRVAEKIAARGAGLGLYLGQTVARAHGTTIQHSGQGSRFSKDGVEYSENTFRVVFV